MATFDQKGWIITHDFDRFEAILNNKDKMPVFYKNYFQSGIIYVSDLLFQLNNIDSFRIVSEEISKTNFLVWTGLRHSIPAHLKTKNGNLSTISLSLKIDNKDFDLMIKKSKDYCTLIQSIRAQFLKNSRLLKRDFNVSEDQLTKGFTLPHTIATEPYIKAF